MSKGISNIRPIYPYTDWEVIEEQFTIENNYRNETIFAQANGYLGFRGNFEEGYPGPKETGLDGTYINGFYESEIIKYGEIAYGFAEKSQTMLNVTNSKIIKLFVDDEEFDMTKGKVTQYKRTLNLKEGILSRELTWTSGSGKSVKIHIERLVSFANKHLAAFSYEVIPLNFDGKVKLVSSINGNVTNLVVDNDPRVGSGLHGRVLSLEEKGTEGTYGFITQKTQNTGFTVTCAMEHAFETGCNYDLRKETGIFDINLVFDIDAKKGEKIVLNKYVAYVTSIDCSKTEQAAFSRRAVEEVKCEGFCGVKSRQKAFLKDFWDKADVVIKGDPALQQGIRVNIFHLLQSVGRDGKTNIAAKGLTGEGYEGHYFWDTEIYVLPFFLYNSPDISRKLLEYRYSILDKARERARQMAHEKGALYPWRTIGGEECSAYFPAGTAQYHINADIAYAVKKYIEATEDYEFLTDYGAEMLFETARVWADLGDFIEEKGNRFCINTVTGPDEYTAIVNNNCYTNLMAKENMAFACFAAEWMKANSNVKYMELVKKLDLQESELEYWRRASEDMYVPYSEKKGIYLQDDGFLNKARWDFENTPPDKYPLLLNYHPLVIYRYQVCKQADLVLALFLLGNRFTLEEKRKNYDFYESITTHDSSLSSCIFSIMASEAGYREKAYNYFMNTARMDLDDTHGNTRNGIHSANMAGAWMCIVNGFAGMRVYEGRLSFSPYLPNGWEEYSFKVSFKGRIINVTTNVNGTDYELLEGDEIEITHNGRERFVRANV